MMAEIIEQRLAAIESRQDQLEKRLDSMSTKIEENTATTNAIKDDTAQIVALFKASQFGAALIKWCAGVGSAVIIGYAAFKGVTGH